MLILVGVIALCFVTELFLVAPPCVPVLKGFIPTLSSESISAAVGILGVWENVDVEKRWKLSF